MGMTRMFNVTNSGPLPTTPITVTVTGANPMDFLMLSNPCMGMILNPMMSCQVVLGFRPTMPALRTAVLSVTAPAGGMPVSGAAMLSGTGL
jgi:hypothetical protein